MASDMNRRLNQGRLYFLLHYVENSDHSDYYFIKKNRNSSAEYQILNEELTSMDEDSFERLQPMMKKLSATFEIEPREGYYMTNIATGECPFCLDYIWNGPFRDVCKHCHAARIFSEAQRSDDTKYYEATKAKLVTYFKNKERVLPTEQKNTTIYSGSVEDAFNCIVDLHARHGNHLISVVYIEYFDLITSQFPFFRG